MHVLPPATRGAKRKIEPEDVDPTQPPASPQQPRSVKLDIEPLEVTYFDDDYPDRDAPSLMSKHPSKRRVRAGCFSVPIGLYFCAHTHLSTSLCSRPRVSLT